MFQNNVFIINSGVPVLNQFGGYSGTPLIVDTATDALYYSLNNAVHKLSPNVGTITVDTVAYIGTTLVIDKASTSGIKVDTASPTWSWRALFGDIASKGRGASDPTFELYRDTIYEHVMDAATSEIFITFHIPVDYVLGSDLWINVHWSQNTVDTGGAAGVPGVIEFNVDMTYAKSYGTAGGSATAFPTVKTITFTQQGSTTQYGHMNKEAVISSTGGSATLLDNSLFEPSGLIMMRLYRIKGNVADTLNQKPFMHSADILYQSRFIGTKQRVPPLYT